MISDKTKKFLFEARVFVWYMTTNPFVQLWDLTANTRSFIWLLLGMTLFSYYMGADLLVKVFGGFFVCLLVYHEWSMKEFIHKYRQYREKRFMGIKDKEDEKND